MHHQQGFYSRKSAVGYTGSCEEDTAQALTGSDQATKNTSMHGACCPLGLLSMAGQPLASISHKCRAEWSHPLSFCVPV